MSNVLSSLVSRLTGGVGKRRKGSRESAPAGLDFIKSNGSKKRAEYKFGATLGHGAFGVVKKARHLPTNAEFAVKTVSKQLVLRKERERQLYRAKQAHLRGELAEDDFAPPTFAMIQHEVAMLRKLSHPHVVRLVDVFETKDDIFLVFPLAGGGELFDRIVDSGRFNEKNAAVLLATVACAVAYLHKMGVCHRDIKPENLLFSSPEPDAPLVVVDFGIAADVGPTKLQSYCGSLGYAAPEVINKKGYSFSADIWSLGMVAHLVPTGMTPFPASRPPMESYIRVTRPDWQPSSQHISSLARRFIKDLMNADPEGRPTAEQVLDHPWLKKAAPKGFLDKLKAINEEALRLSRENETEDAKESLSRMDALHASPSMASPSTGSTSTTTLSSASGRAPSIPDAPTPTPTPTFEAIRAETPLLDDEPHALPPASRSPITLKIERQATPAPSPSPKPTSDSPSRHLNKPDSGFIDPKDAENSSDLRSKITHLRALLEEAEEEYRQSSSRSLTPDDAWDVSINSRKSDSFSRSRSWIKSTFKGIRVSRSPVSTHSRRSMDSDEGDVVGFESNVRTEVVGGVGGML